MKLANLAIFSSQKELKRHQKQFPCQYERIIEEGATFRRYHSMEPAVLYGELIKITHQLNSDLGRCVYIERLNENKWYGATFENGQLLYEHIEPFDILMQTFAYDFIKSESILSPVDANAFLAYTASVTSVDPIDMAQIDDYQLTKIDNYLAAKMMGGIAALVISVFLLTHLFMPKETQTVEREIIIDPAIAFIQTYGSNVPAANALMNATHLLAETALLPLPIKGDSVTLNNRNLTVAVTKNGGSENTWQQWLINTPSMSELYRDGDIDGNGTFSFPLTHQVQWQPFDVSHYLPSLLDALKRLNIAFTINSTMQIGDITSRTMTLTLSDELGKILVLRELIDNPAITTDSLTLTRTSMNEFALSLTLSIHGMTHGN
ncbi:hypothetical protein [uncultured Aliivibrio sp.]|uniref:hypothetical protein n=1 Tax=uncultured Aliivibrio sp. TaxID=873085 RepID=UPI00262D3D10|nr:hypothetical protein [uncultured Aliivibrio sp.]